MPENSRHDRSVGDQGVAEIRPILSQYTHCLGIKWNAQATTGTFCDDNCKSASSRIFLRLRSSCSLFACAASSGGGVGGIDLKCCQLRGTRGGRGYKMLVSALSSQPIPLLSSSNDVHQARMA